MRLRLPLGIAGVLLGLFGVFRLLTQVPPFPLVILALWLVGAHSLARSPRLILLDEPFSALDRDLRKQLTGLVRELVAEAKVPLVHVTHSVAEARLLGDQIIRIDKGKVVTRGTADDVLAGITSLEE